MWVVVDVIDTVKQVGSWVLNECLCDKSVDHLCNHFSVDVHCYLVVPCTFERPGSNFPGFRSECPIIPYKVTFEDFFFSHRALTQDCVLPLTGAVTEAFTFNVNIRESNRVKRA